MRAARILAPLLALVATAGCSKNVCRTGTVFIAYNLPSSAASADSIEIDLSVDGAPATSQTAQRKSQGTSGSIEVDFGTYPSGKSLAFSLSALLDGAVIAEGTKTLTASSGCTQISVDLSSGQNDLGTGDLGIEDMSGKDGSAPVGDLGSADLRSAPDLPPGVISVLAGTPGGAGNFDGVGTLARFQQPSGVVSDGIGNLYVTDMTGNTIRKINLSSNAVTTVAGAPDNSSGSSDGVGSKAKFLYPTGIAAYEVVDDLWVADSGNNTIRWISMSYGTVKTVAGTAGVAGSSDGTSALFSSPNGLAFYGGNLFVCDTGNSTIREISGAQGGNPGTVTTLAGTAGTSATADGTGAGATFSAPRGIVADGTGNLFVTDGYTVRKIVISTGVVTTIAGNPTTAGSTDGTGSSALFSQANGIIYDGNGNLYISDDINNTIRKVVVATGAVTTILGSPSAKAVPVDGPNSVARFEKPMGLALVGQNAFYVADSSAVRLFDAAGTSVSTVAGSWPHDGTADGVGMGAQLWSPLGLVGADANTVYFVEELLAIKKIDLTTKQVTTLKNGASPGFASQQDITVDSTGNLYTTYQNYRQIFKFVTSTDTSTSFAGSTLRQSGSIDAVGSSAKFASPVGIVSSSDGELYVGDAENNTIRKIEISTANVTTIAGTAGMQGSADGTGAAARFFSPSFVALDEVAHILYVSDTGNHTVRAVSLSNYAVTTIAGQAGTPGHSDGARGTALLNAPANLALGPNGNLFVAQPSDSIVRRINLTTGAVDTPLGVAGSVGVKLGALPGSLNSPSGLRFVGNTLLVSDGIEATILAVTGLQ